MYDAGLSKKNGRVVDEKQIRGLAWLSHESKAAFARRHTTVLARWGRAPTDQETCLLLPANWSSLEPLEIIELLQTKKFPGKSEMRLVCNFPSTPSQNPLLTPYSAIQVPRAIPWL